MSPRDPTLRRSCFWPAGRRAHGRPPPAARPAPRASACGSELAVRSVESRGGLRISSSAKEGSDAAASATSVAIPGPANGRTTPSARLKAPAALRRLSSARRHGLDAHLVTRTREQGAHRPRRARRGRPSPLGPGARRASRPTRHFPRAREAVRARSAATARAPAHRGAAAQGPARPTDPASFPVCKTIHATLPRSNARAPGPGRVQPGAEPTNVGEVALERAQRRGKIGRLVDRDLLEERRAARGVRVALEQQARADRLGRHRAGAVGARGIERPRHQRKQRRAESVRDARRVGGREEHRERIFRGAASAPGDRPTTRRRRRGARVAARKTTSRASSFRPLAVSSPSRSRTIVFASFGRGEIGGERGERLARSVERVELIEQRMRKERRGRDRTDRAGRGSSRATEEPASAFPTSAFFRAQRARPGRARMPAEHAACHKLRRLISG